MWNHRLLGVYDLDKPDAVDRRRVTLPTWVGVCFIDGMLASYAAREPDRYDALAAVGFPVIHSRRSDVSLM